MKNSLLVGKPGRDSQADLDTALVVSSKDIQRARDVAESVTSETATVDCHPIILEDSEDDTDRYAASDASSSGFVRKRDARAGGEEREPETTTISAQKPLPPIDVDVELEISVSSFLEETRDLRASVDDETETQERKPVARFDDETMPMPKPDLEALGGALETVPLNAALVQNVLAQVDARAAARAAGQPVPAFQPPQLSPLDPHVAIPSPSPSPRGPAPLAPFAPFAPSTPAAPPRRLGVEIFITMLAFLAVAVPALYFLYAMFE